MGKVLYGVANDEFVLKLLAICDVVKIVVSNSTADKFHVATPPIGSAFD